MSKTPRNKIVEAGRKLAVSLLRQRLGYAIPTSTRALAEMHGELVGGLVADERVTEERLTELQAQCDEQRERVSGLEEQMDRLLAWADAVNYELDEVSESRNTPS